MMRTIHIIMPMAGEGSRFTNEGWSTPKPLIRLDGKALFERAINSIVLEGIHVNYSFIVRQEHIDKYSIDSEVWALYPDANIFPVEKTTRGAVETCLLAENVIETDEAVVIMDCDLEFKSKDLNKAITEILSEPAKMTDGGLLVSFEAQEPRYSYAEIDAQNVVIRTAEKEVISNHALCGAYFFSKADSFLYAAKKLMNEADFDKPEFYVSLLYNYLIGRGETVKLITLDEYHSYGTPEELKHYL